MTSYGGIIRIRLRVEGDSFLSACQHKLPCIYLPVLYTGPDHIARMIFIFTTENAGGVCIGRLRGSHPTSTLIPDVDHAAVGNALTP